MTAPNGNQYREDDERVPFAPPPEALEDTNNRPATTSAGLTESFVPDISTSGLERVDVPSVSGVIAPPAKTPGSLPPSRPATLPGGLPGNITVPGLATGGGSASAVIGIRPNYTAPIQPTATPAPDISVWGTPGSGKSVFLAAAIRMLRTELAVIKPDNRRVNYAVELPVHLDIDSDSRYQTAKEFFKQISASMADGDLPRFNEVGVGMDSKPFPMLVGLPDENHEGKQGRFFTLWMMDSAGENVYDANSRNPYWQNISRARGVLMLVNATQQTPPPRPTGSYGYAQLIANYQTIIGENRRTLPTVAGRTEDQYLALCISQADAIVPGRGLKDIQLDGERTPLALYSPDEAQKLADSEPRLEKLARAYLGGNYQLLKNMYGDRMRIFLTSAVGWVRTPNGYVSNIDPRDSRKLLDYRHWRTFGIVQALLWLFDRIEDERLTLYRTDPGQRDFIRANRRTNMDILHDYLRANPDSRHTL